MNGVRSPESGPDEVAALLVSQLRRHLGDAIESVIAHGSWIHGDFAPERSDLDLLVVLSADPDQGVVESVSPIVDHATSRYPCWHDRLEIGIVSAQGVADVLAGAPNVPVVRISPGEPLHLTQGDRHRLFDWEAARRGRALAGKEPIQVLPDIPPTVLRGLASEQLQRWPEWVDGVDAAGPDAYDFQAYAVLTALRAWALSAHGDQLSKRQAGLQGTHAFPAWSELTTWALDRWYVVGARSAPPQSTEEFMLLLAGAGSGP